MILGIGIDSARIERFVDPGEGLLKRILSTSELLEYEDLTKKNCPPMVKASFLASRFAVKEAYCKARGTGFCSTVSATEITTSHDASGKPFIVLEGSTLDSAPCSITHLSLTHEDPLATAIVIIESSEDFPQSEQDGEN